MSEVYLRLSNGRGVSGWTLVGEMIARCRLILMGIPVLSNHRAQTKLKCTLERTVNKLIINAKKRQVLLSG